MELRSFPACGAPNAMTSFLLIAGLPIPPDGPSPSACGLDEEEELEVSGPAEFTCFSEDLVAEQLTYMDAVGLRQGTARRVQVMVARLWGLQEAVEVEAGLISHLGDPSK